MLHVYAHVSPSTATRLALSTAGIVRIDYDPAIDLTGPQREALAECIRTDAPGRGPAAPAGEPWIVAADRYPYEMAPLTATGLAGLRTYLDAIVAARAQAAAEKAAAAARAAAAEAAKRAEAMAQAALPVSEQVRQGWGTQPWVVVEPLGYYADLRGPAEREAQRLNDEIAARLAQSQAAEEARKAAAAAARQVTLRAATARYLPDLLTSWDAGELAERSVVAEIRRDLADLAGDVPQAPPMPEGGRVTSSSVDTLPANVLRLWLTARPRIISAFGTLAERLGAEAGPVTIEMSRDNGWRKADFDDPDDVEEADSDGEINVWTAYEVAANCAVGGIDLTITWHADENAQPPAPVPAPVRYEVRIYGQQCGPKAGRAVPQPVLDRRSPDAGESDDWTLYAGTGEELEKEARDLLEIADRQSDAGYARHLRRTAESILGELNIRI